MIAIAIGIYISDMYDCTHAYMHALLSIVGSNADTSRSNSRHVQSIVPYVRYCLTVCVRSAPHCSPSKNELQHTNSEVYIIIILLILII